MDFEEFLWAKGDSITIPAIRQAFERRKPLGDAIHRKMMQLFRTYMAVGGMPQAISAYLDGRTYEEIDFIKRNILSLYEEDLKKYDDDNREKASVIFKTIPEQLENHNSHFKFSLVDTIKIEDRYIIYGKDLKVRNSRRYDSKPAKAIGDGKRGACELCNQYGKNIY